MAKSDAESIQGYLSTLAAKGKVVFALLCAERLLLCLRKLGDMRSDLKPEPVEQALEHAFRVAKGEAPFDADQIRNLLSVCEDGLIFIVEDFPEGSVACSYARQLPAFDVAFADRVADNLVRHHPLRGRDELGGPIDRWTILSLRRKP